MCLTVEIIFMKFKESETLELKKTTSELKEAIISIAAILNKHQKGEVYFGIRDNGEIIGQDISNKTLRDVSKAISEHIEPKIFPHITIKKLSGKSCIYVKFTGSEIPYFAYGRAYIRVGPADRQLSAKELEKMILKRHKFLWEDEKSDKSIRDVNISVLKEFIGKANKARRINFKYTNAKNTLNKLNLIKGNKLLKATEILFSDNNSSEVQAAVFAGIDKLTFLDIQLFKGNFFSLLKQSESYIKEHMNWRADLTPEGREEIPEVPLRAITEAIVNSLCHRDYTNSKGNEIAFFKDRIEIYNSGQFPEEHTPEDYIKGNEKSILRNPLIANTLYLGKDIEKWGSGLKRIYDACREAKVKVKFENLKSGFLVTFYRPSPQVTPQATPQVAEDKHLRTLTELETKILSLIKENARISRNEIARSLNITAGTVKEYLKRLKNKNIIKRYGSTSAGYWEIIKFK